MTITTRFCVRPLLRALSPACNTRLSQMCRVRMLQVPPAARGENPIAGHAVRPFSVGLSPNEDSSGAADSSSTMFSTGEAPDPKHDILKAALTHVNTHGWSVQSISSAATDCGYPSVSHGLFSRGAVELVEYFMAEGNGHMVEALSAMPEEAIPADPHERLKLAIRTRLEFVGPYVQNWASGMALGALPTNFPATASSLGEIADTAWAFAHHQDLCQSQPSAFSPQAARRRSMVTAVYASTELFMLTDYSADFQDTWDFLDRRLSDVTDLENAPEVTRTVAGAVATGMQSLGAAAFAMTTSALTVEQAMSKAGSAFGNHASTGMYMGNGMPSPPDNPFTLHEDKKDGE